MKVVDSVIQPSFSKGELAPSLYGRVDLSAYKSGVALMRNMFVDYRGGASNRPGTLYVGQCKSNDANFPPRLLPFQFSTLADQSYVLEFGDEYFRPILDGAYILEAAKSVLSITQANPGVVTVTAHGYLAGDWVWMIGAAGMTQVNQRAFVVTAPTTDTFQLALPNGTLVNTSTYGAYTSGGTVARFYTVETPYAIEDLYDIKYAQVADIMTLTHPDYAPMTISRTGHTTWTITEAQFKTAVTSPAAPTLEASVASIASSSMVLAYQVTAVNALGDESLPSAATAIESYDITVQPTSSTAPGNIKITWDAQANIDYYIVYKASPIRTPTADQIISIQTSSIYGYMTSTEGTVATDSNIAPDFSKTPPLKNDPFSPGQVIDVQPVAVGSGYTSFPTVTVGSPPAGGLIARVNAVINNGEVISYIIVDPGYGYLTAPTITVTGGGGSSATAVATLGAVTGTYPSAVAYFNQRRVFGGSDNSPQTFWMSQPGLYGNFNVSIPSRDDDSIEGSIVATQVNAIRHLVPMPGGLIVMTAYGAWLVSGSGQNTAITPLNANAQAQVYNGASNQTPIVVNADILYIQSKGSAVRNLTGNIYANIYTGTDISLLSSHLFYGYTFRDWTFAEEPYKLVWMSRSDGAAISCAFLKEQEVVGWSHHDTKGLFKSSCAITEGNENATYFIIQRLVGGSLVYYTERLASRLLRGDIENSWFLDCAIANSTFYPAATLSPASRGTGLVSCSASASVFFSGLVSRVLRIGGGKGSIVSETGTACVVNFTDAIEDVFTDDPAETPVPQVEGEWGIASLVATVGGLWHLEGQLVGVFADGTYRGTATVTNGIVTIPGAAASKIVVGLLYTAQMQTLRLDVGDPTVQGKRKQIFSLTTITNDTSGISVGPTFDTLQAWRPDAQNFAGEIDNGLYSGEYRINMAPGWNIPGQMCIQQSAPLPVTILGVVPEIGVGDNSR